MMTEILLLIAGLVLLIKSADWLVSGASALAKRYNVSDLAIGLTVVAFGTSAPELVVNMIASSQNLNDIVFGNVIGSNIANLFLILGITGLIYPLIVQSSTLPCLPAERKNWIAGKRQFCCYFTFYISDFSFQMKYKMMKTASRQ